MIWVINSTIEYVNSGEGYADKQKCWVNLKLDKTFLDIIRIYEKHLNLYSSQDLHLYLMIQLKYANTAGCFL